MRYWVLQHAEFETPGVLLDLISANGDPLRTTGLYRNDPMPSTADFDALIVMGGPMSIHDETEYAWLRAEKELIRAAIAEGKKVLGICLGAQLIAAVCGARVYQNPVKEIGWWPVRWEEGAGRAVGAQGAVETIVFHWHGETFGLPEGAVRLASTEACINQAFRLGDRVLGIQFHPEVTPEIIRGMVEHEGWELVDAPFVQSREEILGGAAENFGKDEDPGMALLREWL